MNTLSNGSATAYTIRMYRNQRQRDFARTLRNAATNAEKHLWQFLRAKQLGGHKFRRQVALGHYIVDFACLAQKLIIELDGPQHLEPAATDYDIERDAWLTARGYRILRFRNQEVDDNLQAVLNIISQALKATPLPNPSLQGEGIDPKG
jgi:very-short-patch-repair endonuclease